MVAEASVGLVTVPVEAAAGKGTLDEVEPIVPLENRAVAVGLFLVLSILAEQPPEAVVDVFRQLG